MRSTLRLYRCIRFDPTGSLSPQLRHDLQSSLPACFSKRFCAYVIFVLSDVQFLFREKLPIKRVAVQNNNDVGTTTQRRSVVADAAFDGTYLAASLMLYSRKAQNMSLRFWLRWYKLRCLSPRNMAFTRPTSGKGQEVLLLSTTHMTQ
jgi:hypothetical protein